jgi:type I restriction enzyme R subunit
VTAHACTEDQLVEQPAAGLFAVLGWETVTALDETFGAGGLLGRETKAEVVLLSRLHAALVRLNPGLPDEAITIAVDELTRDRSLPDWPRVKSRLDGLIFPIGRSRL